MSKFYITTAITYASGTPHIGNCYEIVLTDAVARHRRALGDDVYFLTGSDEHGQKIAEKAAAAGVTPKEFVDKTVAAIEEIWRSFNTTFDKFIRTTDPYHEKTVQKIFKKLYDKGDIYKGEYEGMYCTPCESFWTSSQLQDGKCPDCGRECIPAKEEAYFLKLSAFQGWLEQFIEENPDFIYPESRKKEMLNNFIKPGILDLCVSRTTVKWGIPVDFDPKHVIYIWIDALSNYITAIGYDTETPTEQFQKLWGADLQIIGKDIMRFHSIYWPIILHCLDLPLPRQIFGHAWLLSGGDKMSKSKGNTIYSKELIKFFGVDAARFYLLQAMPFGDDGVITYENVISVFNTDLANNIGNLVSRTISMSQKYFGGIIGTPHNTEEFDKDLIETAFLCRDNYLKNFETLHIADAIKNITDLGRRLNKYIDETTPWVLAKDETKKERLGAVIYNLLEGIRFIAVMLIPIMPETSEKIIKALGNPPENLESLCNFGGLKAGGSVQTIENLFIRIDEKKMIEEIEKYRENEQ
jgi:methionyl-tRNA synthetase